MQPRAGYFGVDWGRARRLMLWLVSVFGFLAVGFFSGSIGVSASPQRAALLNGTIPPGGTLPPAPVVQGRGQVRVIHLAPFAAATNDTAVDVCREDNSAVSGLTGLVYGSQSGYQVFATGNHDWKVTEPGCGALVVDLPLFQLYADTVLTIYAIGDGVNQPFATWLNVDRPGASLVRYLPFLFHRHQPVAQ